MHEFSQNKQFQKKARESVMLGLEKQDGDLNYESLKEMSYLEQCMNGLWFLLRDQQFFKGSLHS